MTQPHAQTGRFYGDKERTPVPFPSYRCKGTAKEKRSRTNPNLTYTHQCKLATDHSGDHRCVCGKCWPPLADVMKGMSE